VTPVSELWTPALVVDADVLEANLTTMSSALPGPRLRPHVKAHKCSALARRQVELGHPGLTCATVREVERLAAAGLGADLLLANEVVDARRLGVVGDRYGARVTVAVDSEETVRAAAGGRCWSTSTWACRGAAAGRRRRGGWPTWPGRSG
jgi:D-serine deaminase-like pyridoxal phosphate-dependent protein